MAGSRRDGLLRIGELAARAGASADTVRYYERLRLLGPPARSESGYRLYSAVELGRLRFIRRAKRLGLSLEEIRSLLGVAEEGASRARRPTGTSSRLSGSRCLGTPRRWRSSQTSVSNGLPASRRSTIGVPRRARVDVAEGCLRGQEPRCSAAFPKAGSPFHRWPASERVVEYCSGSSYCLYAATNMKHYNTRASSAVLPT